MHRSLTGPVLAAAMAALLAGCATTAVSEGPGPTPHERSNRPAAVAEVHRLLADVRLPPSKRRVRRVAHPIGGVELDANRTAAYATQSWRVSMSVPAAVAWLREHQPRTTTREQFVGGDAENIVGWDWPDTSAYADASLQISISRLGTRQSGWYVEAAATPFDSRPLRDSAHVRRMTLAVGQSCPTLTRAVGVRPRGPKLRTLLPAGRPKAVLACRYGPMNRQGATALAASRTLRGDEAARLATAVRALPLTHIDGAVYNCASDDNASVIFAFAYADHGAVDVRYGSSGCQTVANGQIVAFGVADGFAALVRRAVG